MATDQREDWAEALPPCQGQVHCQVGSHVSGGLNRLRQESLNFVKALLNSQFKFGAVVRQHRCGHGTKIAIWLKKSKTGPGNTPSRTVMIAVNAIATAAGPSDWTTATPSAGSRKNIT